MDFRHFGLVQARQSSVMSLVQPPMLQYFGIRVITVLQNDIRSFLGPFQDGRENGIKMKAGGLDGLAGSVGLLYTIVT